MEGLLKNLFGEEFSFIYLLKGFGRIILIHFQGESYEKSSCPYGITGICLIASQLSAKTSTGLRAIIKLAKGGEIVIKFYPNDAPKSVANFIKLAKKVSMDGLTFHRVVPGFVAQGGDPNGDGSGGPGYTIKGEFTDNGVNNTQKHVKGCGHGPDQFLIPP